MRPDTPLSLRQRRMIDRKPNIETIRQKSTIEMSDRMVRGFKANAQRIAQRQGISYDSAAAILAATSRRASAAAIRKNPRLKRVKGKGDNK